MMWSYTLLLGVFTTLALCKKPNIVFVLTDDQDWHMDSLKYMPLVQKYLINEGTLFDKHYCTVSICCPSRVNLWTGYAAHNSNVTDLFPPYGGYPKFVEEGLNENWLPYHLQNAGYNTYYVGKLFNAHTVDNYNDPPVNGFNESDFLLDPYTYEYFHAKMTRNAQEPVSYKGQYSPDVVATKAYDFLEEASLHERPFFLGVAPIAPHSNVKFQRPSNFDTAFYAERHAHLFKDYKIPRTPNFNPENPASVPQVSWMKRLPVLNETVIDYHDEFQRSRLRALQSVDEMVEKLVHKLEVKGLLDNTYIIYSTDNGYHISQWRLPPGKECPFETDVHIPLIIRGPGVPAGHVAGVVSSHTDLTPTILKLAGAERDDLDGFPIPLTAKELANPESGEHVNVEFWGRAIPEGKYGWLGDDKIPSIGGSPRNVGNTTYKTLRLIGENYNLMYTVWCTGDKQFYDLQRDPYQVQNYFDASISVQESYSLMGKSLKKVISRLDALLMVTKSCKAKECHKPWKTLHPDDDVKSLTHAMKTEFDAFYEDQPRVGFSSCPLGHLIAEEGPQNVNDWNSYEQGPTSQYGEQETFQYHGDESIWT